MRTVLNLSILLLTFLGIANAATPDQKTQQIFIQARFIEITEPAPGPLIGAPLPAPLDVARKVPGLLGTLTDPQFQALIRELSKRKGVDFLSAPGLTTRVGQQAKIEITRELVYKDQAGERAVKNVGITFAVLPKTTADDQADLVLSPQIVEFHGFVNHKSGWDEPIFSERKAAVSVVMTSGQTIVLEMDPKTDKQLVEVENEAGQVISSKTMLYSKRTLVFVTAHLVGPATGKPRVPKHAAAMPPRTPSPTNALGHTRPAPAKRISRDAASRLSIEH